LKPAILLGAELLAIAAGWTDFRSRRIPNWLTVSGLLAGIAVNTALFGWAGLKAGLLGVVVGLGLLLPFVLLRSLGAEGRATMLEMPQFGVSSSAVRERAAAGRPLRYLVPEPVARFIEEKGIYA